MNTTTARDVRAEWIAAFDEADDLLQPAPVVAASVVGRLLAEDPELLRAWLLENAASIATEWLGQRRRSRRLMLRVSAPRSAFGRAAEISAAGDDTALDPFLVVTYVVDDEGSNKPLGQMTRDDWGYVENDYRSRAEAHAFEAAVAAAIRRRLKPGQVTSDAFTYEQILTLRSALARKASAA